MSRLSSHSNRLNKVEFETDIYMSVIQQEDGLCSIERFLQSGVWVM